MKQVQMKIYETNTEYVLPLHHVLPQFYLSGLALKFGTVLIPGLFLL